MDFSNGTYYLVETKTNDGYNLLKKPIEVILNVQYTTITKTESAWVEDNKWTKTGKERDYRNYIYFRRFNYSTRYKSTESY